MPAGPAPAFNGQVIAARLTDVLDVTPLAPGLFCGAAPDRLAGAVFGGHLIGQALAAAARTVTGQRRPHSLHAYFLRRGRPGQDLEYRVRTLRDGFTFNARGVDICQGGELIAELSASFAQDLDGARHQDPMPAAPDPESLPPLADLVRAEPGIWPPLYQTWTLFDVRFAVPPHDRRSRPADASAGRSQVWLRATDPGPAGPLPADPVWQACALAYVSDLTLMTATLPVQGLRPDLPGLSVASLDHAVWFHRPCVVTDWLLYDQSVPATSSGLALATGRLFTRDGALVASVTQQGMVRPG
jgi:acyl-CoA thioesterase-2